jgi:hypothetical protein
MSELTKDEFRALLEIQAKNVEQLTTIANHLTTIVDTENSIHDRLHNGMGKEIAQMVVKHQEDMLVFEKEKEKSLEEKFQETLEHCHIARDIRHTKWFVGALGLVIIISLVVIKTLDGRETASKETTQELKKMSLILDNLVYRKIP